MHNHDNKFDLDLQYGQDGERWLAWLGTDQAKVEVKTERDQWAHTGNAVFEFTSRGKPSGIAVTQADYWVHNFHLNGRTMLTFPRPQGLPAHLLPNQGLCWLTHYQCRR